MGYPNQVASYLIIIIGNNNIAVSWQGHFMPTGIPMVSTLSLQLETCRHVNQAYTELLRAFCRLLSQLIVIHPSTSPSISFLCHPEHNVTVKSVTCERPGHLATSTIAVKKFQKSNVNLQLTSQLKLPHPRYHQHGMRSIVITVNYHWKVEGSKGVFSQVFVVLRYIYIYIHIYRQTQPIILPPLSNVEQASHTH